MVNLRELISNQTGTVYILKHSIYREPLRYVTLLGQPKPVNYKMVISKEGDIKLDRKKRVTEVAPKGANAFHITRDKLAVKPFDWVCEVQYLHIQEDELRRADEAEAKVLAAERDLLNRISSL